MPVDLLGVLHVRFYAHDFELYPVLPRHGFVEVWKHQGQKDGSRAESDFLFLPLVQKPIQYFLVLLDKSGGSMKIDTVG